MAKAADEMISAALNRLHPWKLRTRAPINATLYIFSFLALLPSFPFSAHPILPSYSFPTHDLPLHVHAPFPLHHLLRLVGYLLTVQVDAAVRDHGAGFSGGKVSVHVRLHLQERAGGGREAGRQLIWKFGSSLSVALLMAELLPVFLRHLQIQRGIIQVRL